MALENRVEFSGKTPTRSSLKAALFAALTASVVPQGVEAQPARAPRCTALLEGRHSFQEWLQNGQQLFVCSNLQQNPIDRSTVASLALVAFYHSVTDATDVSSIRADARNAADYNIRAVGLRVFDVAPVRLTGPLSAAPTVAEITTRNAVIRSSNARKNANLAAMAAFVNSIVPPGVTVTVSEQPDVLRRTSHIRNLGRIMLEATDRNIQALSQVFLDTLRPLAQRMNICRDATVPQRSNSLTVLSRLLCNQQRVVSYPEFLILAGEIAQQAPVDNGVVWPNSLVEGTQTLDGNNWRLDQLGLREPDRPVNLMRLVDVLGEQFYLLHLYAHLVADLDNLAVRFGGANLLPTLTLVNRIAPGSIDTVIRPDAETPLPQTPSAHLVDRVPSLVIPPSIESPQHIAWRQRVAARASRVRLMRLIGISGAAAGVVTFGIAGGVNLAERGEATSVIDSPLWQGRIAETNMFVRNARAGMYSAAELEAGNARTRRYAAEYSAAVQEHNGTISATQVAAWTGVGIAVFGGALAVLADVIAGPVPVEPRETNVPAAPGQQGPHPAPAGRRAEVEGSGVGFTPSIAVDGTSVNVGGTVTF